MPLGEPKPPNRNWKSSTCSRLKVFLRFFRAFRAGRQDSDSYLTAVHRRREHRVRVFPLIPRADVGSVIGAQPDEAFLCPLEQHLADLSLGNAVVKCQQRSSNVPAIL